MGRSSKIHMVKNHSFAVRTVPPLNRIAEKTILNYLSGLEIEQTVNDSINQIIYNMFNFTDEEIRYIKENALK